MKDLLISAVANYTPDKIRPYITSLNRTGFSGDKVMITYNLPKDTIVYLVKEGWECYENTLRGHPHMQRLIDMWWFLQNDERKWNHIITTDVRDIVWQTNPSEWLSSNLTKPIMVASECILHDYEPWAHKNIHEGYGPLFWEWVKNNVVANVGVMAGKHDSLKDLLMLNWITSQAGNTMHFTDQSSLNLLINTTLLKDKVDVNSNFALQVATLSNEKRFDKKDIVIKDGYVMNGDVPYVLVHQYDRNPTLTKLVENTYL